MRKTMELIRRLKEALEAGRIRSAEIPINDVKKCVQAELRLYESTYTKAQYEELQKSFEEYCACVEEGENDTDRVRMFLSGMCLCLHTISDAVLSLANRRYWELWHRDEMEDPEIAEIVDYVGRKGDVRLLNYDFVDGYMALPCTVVYDETCGMNYVPHKGRRMYFPEGWEEQRIADYYRNLLSEQDAYSPHCYQRAGFELREGDIVVDAGAAEGVFTLDHIDEAGHIYVIDADMAWIRALRQTFANDMEKIDIIYGYLGDHSDGEENLSLDALLGGKRIDYIKMDIEGYEKATLLGGREAARGECDHLCDLRLSLPGGCGMDHAFSGE